jgi:hypothetical protein
MNLLTNHESSSPLKRDNIQRQSQREDLLISALSLPCADYQFAKQSFSKLAHEITENNAAMVRGETFSQEPKMF